MKKRTVILSTVLIISAIILIISITIKTQDYKKTDAKRFSEEYEITENNVFVYKNPTEIINILKYGTGVVYLGFPECPWCRAYVEILNEAAKEKDINKIYYLNILEDRKNDTDDYKKIVSLLEENLSYDEEGKKRIYVPDVTIVNHGQIVGHDNETSIVMEEISPDEYWTDNKKQDLKSKLKLYFEKIEKPSCSDSCNR